jgi:hypothetical protein
MSLVDLDSHDRPALAVRGQRIELARAPVGAVAVGEFLAVNRPLCLRHGTTP